MKTLPAERLDVRRNFYSQMVPEQRKKVPLALKQAKKRREFLSEKLPEVVGIAGMAAATVRNGGAVYTRGEETPDRYAATI